MKLYLVISSFIDRVPGEVVQSLTSLISGETEAEAICKHVEEGSKRWPRHLHDANALAIQDVTERAIRFVIDGK